MDVYLALLAVLVGAMVIFFVVLYVWPGVRGRDAEKTDRAGYGPLLVRTYQGRSQRDVVVRYMRDAQDLAVRGYEPVSQSWGDGQWDVALFLLALILSLFGIGLVLLAYMAIIRPEGTLVVTFRQASGSSEALA